MNARAAASALLTAVLLAGSPAAGAPPPSIARGFTSFLPAPPSVPTAIVPLPGQNGLIALPTPPSVNLSTPAITQVPGFRQTGGTGGVVTTLVPPIASGSTVALVGPPLTIAQPSSFVVYNGGYTMLTQAYGYPTYPVLPAGMIRSPYGPQRQAGVSTPPQRPPPVPETSPEATASPAVPAASPAPAPAREAGPVAADPADLPLDQGMQAMIEAEAASVPGQRVAIVVYDLMGRRRAVVQPDPTLYPGALMKLAVMLGVFREIKDGKLAATGELGDLLNRMIAHGDHDAANALIDRVSMARVNAVALDEGFADTSLSRRFNDPSPAPGSRLNAMSPLDSARFFYRLARRDLVDAAASERMLQLLGRQTRNEGIPQGIGMAPGTLVSHLPASASLTDQGEVSDDVALVTGPAHAYVLAIFTTAPGDQTSWIARVSGKIHKLLTAPRP